MSGIVFCVIFELLLVECIYIFMVVVNFYKQFIDNLWYFRVSYLLFQNGLFVFFDVYFNNNCICSFKVQSFCYELCDVEGIGVGVIVV